MNRRSGYLDLSFWIVGGALVLYVLIFAAIWCDAFVWKTDFVNALPTEVLNLLKILYTPVFVLLHKLGFLP